MTWIITIAISNAVIASCLGLLAHFVGRYSKSAAVGHALWILVLVKLVTPPLFELPLPVLPSWTASAQVAEEKQRLTPRTSTARANSETGITVIATETVSMSTEPSHAFRLGGIKPWLLKIWLLGIVAYGLYQIYVTWQMCKLMKLAIPDCRIDRAMHRIATRARVKNYPIARVVPWIGSPMLWGLGGTSVIVLPEQLFDSLDDDAADTLMQHELAHFQRGDQWVRILEVIASTVFWWHPIVWLAMREIEVYEEQCCDAWVVRQDRANRRRYAEALLDTVDFISDAPENAKPFAASGLGRVPLLKQRLKAIMRGDRQRLNSQARMGLAAILALVPLHPKLLQATFFNSHDVSPTVVVEAPTPVVVEDAFAEFVGGVKQHRAQTLAEKIESRAPIPEIEYARADSVYGTYQLIATSGYRAKLRETITGKTIDLSAHGISCVAFAPPNDEAPKFVAGCADGSVCLIDCGSGEVIQQLGKFSGMIHSVEYSRKGDQLAVGGNDGIVHLIDMDDGTIRSFEESFGSVRSVRFSQDGQRLAVATDTTWNSSSPGRVDIWNVASASREQTILCPTSVGVAGFSETGNILTVEWNGVLRTWSARGDLLSAVVKPKDTISAAAFSPHAITLETLSASVSN